MSSNPLKVLIVEDNLILSLFEERLITQMGHEVIDKVTSGEEAVPLSQKHPPDLIIMDIFLSGTITGLEAAQKIRKHLKVPILFISGNRDLYQKKYPTLLGINEFISKPFTKDELIKTLEHILKKQKKLAGGSKKKGSFH